MKKGNATFYIIALVAAALLVWGIVAFTGDRDTVAIDDTTDTDTTDTTETPTTASGDLLIAITYDEEDLNSSWDDSTATHIVLSDGKSTVTGSGATVSNNTVTITAAGTYVISGELSDGQLRVNAGDNDLVRLVLNGVTISNTTSAPIYVQNADKAIVTLADDSINTLSDGTSYVYDGTTDEPDATLFSKVDLTLNGSGTLIVDGNYNNAIGTKDDLVIISGTYQISAANDALRGRDSVVIKDGEFTLESQGDGIQSNNDEDTTKGWIAIEGGTFDITAVNDGIQAETILQITGGDFTIETTSASSDDSVKGLKSVTDMLITGGTFTLDTVDDAIHSNSNITIRGGSFVITTDDDGVHADGDLLIEGGSIDILSSYEGLEAANITIDDGSISIVASDDGMNAAGGNDGQATTGNRFDNFSQSGNYAIVINGGYVVIDSTGDGVDSNGSLTINGGTLIVNGPLRDGDGSLDFDGTGSVNGGTVIAVGSSGMLQSFGSTSTQNVLTVYMNSMMEAGAVFNIADSDGNSIFAFAPTKTYQSVIVSLPELVSGATYTLSVGGTYVGDIKDGLYTSGTYSGGTDLISVTLSQTITTISGSGQPVNNQQGPSRRP